jgi:hypothetical protein
VKIALAPLDDLAYLARARVVRIVGLEANRPIRTQFERRIGDFELFFRRGAPWENTDEA